MPRKDASVRRLSDRGRRREQILAAATALYAEKGIENVTFGDVARRARLSRPLIYFYFPDPRSLFLEAVLRAQSRLLSRFQSAVGDGGSGLDQIERIGRAYAAFHLEDPSAFQVCNAYDVRPAPPTDDPLSGRLAEAEATLHGLCVEAIERGRRDGSIRADIAPAPAVALVLWGCVHGLTQLGATREHIFHAEAGLTSAEYLDAGFTVLRAALKPPG